MTRAQFRRLTIVTAAASLPIVGSGMLGGPILAQATPPDAQGKVQPSPEVYRKGNGVVLPRVVRERKPRYTVAAMREKIQGKVLLECVVLPNGTVGSVQVVRSLDSRFGLDREAIAAAKEWRFEPGTKDGVPVAVLVTIELTFTLRDTPRDIAPPTMPAAFSATGQGTATSDAEWEQKEVQASSLTVSFSHPKDWVVILDLGVPFSMQRPDGSLLASMMPPTPTKIGVLEPATRAGLDQAAETVASGYDRQVADVGQTQFAGRLWVWFDMGVADTPTSVLQALPPDVAPTRGSNHLWLFSTVVADQQVLVAFQIFSPRGTRQEGWETQRLSAGPTFARIIEHMSFTRTK